MKFQLILDKTAAETVVATVHAPSALTDHIEALVMQHSGTDTVQAYNEDDIVLLPFRDIECLFVSGGKTYAVCADGERFRLKARLYELEQCAPAAFIRINKSAIANIKQLERFSATYAGGVNAIFKSGYTDYVSRRCFADIKRRLRST